MKKKQPGVQKSQENQGIWLAWFHRVDTGKYTSFHGWGNDADEVLTWIRKSFFDKNNLQKINIDSENQCSLVQSKNISFPSDCMQLLNIRRFKTADELNAIRTEESRSKYVNRYI